MTLYVSRRKRFVAWLLFIMGLTSALVVAVIAGFSFWSMFSFWLQSIISVGIMALGMYALSQIYSCPRCGKCIIRDVLFAQLGRKTQTTCPDCVRSIDIVMER